MSLSRCPRLVRTISQLNLVAVRQRVIDDVEYALFEVPLGEPLLLPRRTAGLTKLRGIVCHFGLGLGAPGDIPVPLDFLLLRDWAPDRQGAFTKVENDVIGVRKRCRIRYSRPA